MQVIGPWEEQAPSVPAQIALEGFRNGIAASSAQASSNEAGARMGMAQQEMMQNMHEQGIADELAKQKMKMSTDAAARMFQGQAMIEQSIANGMSPVQAYLLYGPQATGGKMTGMAPFLNQYIKSQAPPPQIIEPKPVFSDDGMSIIGYADKNGTVHYLPQPKAAPPQTVTETETFKGTPAVPPKPAVPPSGHDFLPWHPYDPGRPATPGVPEQPARRIVRKLPVDAGESATAPENTVAQEYKTTDDVAAAYKAGDINREQATQILQNQFGIQ